MLNTVHGADFLGVVVSVISDAAAVVFFVVVVVVVAAAAVVVVCEPVSSLNFKIRIDV